MQERNFSLRDLRSRFHVDTMQRDFYGEYDTSINTRRWYFRTADDCLNAQKFLSKFELHSLHFPGAHEAHRNLLAIGGRKIVAHNAPEQDKRSVKRGVDFYVFPSAEARFEASALLRKQLMAPASSVASLDALLKSTPADTFAGTTPQRIRERLTNVPLTLHEVETHTARIEAAQKSRPRSSSALADDRKQTIESALATCERLNLTPFCETPAYLPDASGAIVGILVGRGAHTLAVQTDEEGHGVLLDRWKISTPLRQQYPVERAFDLGAAIHVQVNDGLGDALQLRGERDFHYGSLLLRAQRVAQERAVFPILETEDLRDQDCNGDIVAHDDLTGAVLDDGGFLTVGSLDDFGQLTQGRVRVGPTYFYAPKVYARSATR